MPGDWLLILIVVLTPVWVVLGFTIYAMVANAVERHRALRDMDGIRYGRHLDS